MNNRAPLSSFAVCFLLLFLANNSYSQGCCGIGGSLVSGGYPVLNKNTFLLSTAGNYADAKNPDRMRSGIGMLLAYGISDRLSLSLKTSYVWATYSSYRWPIPKPNGDTIPGETDIYKNNGFGDGYAAVQFALIRLTPMNKQELIAGMDVGLPWGPDKTMDAGVVLPGNIQTGTGGYSVNGFLTYLKAFPAIYYSVTSTIAGRVNFKTRRGKEPGDEFSAMLTSLVGPFYNFRGSVTFNYYRNGKTYDPEYRSIVSYGKRLSLVPALEYSISSNFVFLMNADIPLWRDEYQLNYGNDKIIRAEIYWFIHKPDNSPQIKAITF
jgi:hypothetical protein